MKVKQQSRSLERKVPSRNSSFTQPRIIHSNSHHERNVWKGYLLRIMFNQRIHMVAFLAFMLCVSTYNIRNIQMNTARVIDVTQPPLRGSSQQQQQPSSILSIANNNDTTTTVDDNGPKEIPIVIISSLRAEYLEQVLDSLTKQLPNTPDWIAKSPRYVFVHKHQKNMIGKAFAKVTSLAQQYNYTIRHFHGLRYQRQKMNVNANYAWYRMMRFLFHNIGATEALILEDDALLAPDGLMMASALFREKWQRNDIHAIVLGAWSGTNRILADPYTFHAVRNRYFQAMAYSMNVTIFDQLEEAKAKYLLYGKSEKVVPDWTEEITVNKYIRNLTQLTPSVGRMRHIGALGMGGSGTGTVKAGKETRNLLDGNPWDLWKDAVEDSNKTIDSYYLHPKETTDKWGFVCTPLKFDCGQARGNFNLYVRGQALFNISRYVTDTSTIENSNDDSENEESKDAVITNATSQDARK